jgi:hypothetical protein
VERLERSSVKTFAQASPAIRFAQPALSFLDLRVRGWLEVGDSPTHHTNGAEEADAEQHES